MNRFRSWLHKAPAAMLASTALLIPALGAAPPGAVAAPDGSRGPGSTTMDARSDAAAHGAQTDQVTLITGDRISLTTYPDGRVAVTADPARRADGSTPGFDKRVVDDHVLVIPTDVLRYVPDTLDPALFDITALVAQGYGDESSETVPVIVDYGPAGAQRHAPTAVPTLRRTMTVPAIGAVAGEVSKSKAEDRGLAMLTPALLRTVDKVWLDQQVHATDEDSAPQINAPTAWDAGFTGAGVDVAVLDTGIDSTHPDLQGKVVAEQNFTDTADALDHYGHGTHVASIVAGTGAASGGLRKGIAYDADLLNGKVLDDFGNGPLSGVMAGMEWAVDNGADVVNMSLGVRGLYTDGTDPLSQLVNALSESSDTLFVIAAGNDGPGDSTVTTPGAATQALTVGAVDKSDVLAGFSSRGPRAGDFALKPDVTAPGVDIIAARAAGTNLGTPVGDDYTSLSGTSMATPHVAGAAALLAQQRPELTGQDLKDLLTSTAVPQDASVYEQGGGRIDLARAIAPSVLPDTASLSMGYFPYPQNEAAPVTEAVTYSNLGEQAVTLSLALDVTDQDGGAPADGMVSLDADTLAVPAGGQARVQVTVDPSVGDFGLYGGYLTATDASGKVTRTTVGFYKESERYDLTVAGIAPDGRPAGGISMVDVINVDDSQQFAVVGEGFTDGSATFRVPPGHYSVQGYLFTYDEPQVYATGAAAVAEPQVIVEGDTEVTLDGRDANPLEVGTRQPSKSTLVTLNYWRKDALGASQSHSFTLSPPIDEFSAAPTDRVTTGDFEFYSQWTLEAPDVRITTLDDQRALDAEYVFNSARLDGDFRTDLVYAGLGRPEDFAGIDVDGKMALIRRGELTFLDKMHNAEAAGARAAIIFNNVPGLLLISGDPATIPTLSMTQSDGEALVARMSDGTLPVDVQATRVSPYLFDVIFPEPDQIPAALDYQVSDDNSVTIDNHYRSHVAPHGVGELRHKWRPWEFASIGFLRRLDAPMERTEYVSSGNTRWAQYFYGNSTDAGPFGFPLQDEPTTFRAGRHLTDSWLTQVMVPGLWPGSEDPTEASVYRDGSTLHASLPEWGDREAHWGFATPEDTTAFRLYEDGRLIAETPRGVGDFAVGTDAATYRLELDVNRQADWWRMSTATRSAWTVHSAQPGATPEVLPLLHVDYRVSRLDLLDRTSRVHKVTLDVSHQPGAGTSRIAGAQLWVSTDDGESWRELRMHRKGRGGNFFAVVNGLDRRADFVSLKLKAWDADGNQLEQDVTRAYEIR